MSSDASAHGGYYYNVAGPGSLPTRVSRYQRRRMFLAFMQSMSPAPQDTVADVGVASDRQHDHSNYFEAWYSFPGKITAIGVDDASFLERAYPGLRFIRASGLALPFADASFDFVHSSAVIEHVGNFANQIRLLAEMWRVAKRGIFVTTPNRWFPIEVHTVLPFLHYLPPRQYRIILKQLGLGYFAEESNLNLMSRQTMAAAAAKAGMPAFHIAFARLLGLGSNLMLVARKHGAS